MCRYIWLHRIIQIKISLIDILTRFERGKHSWNFVDSTVWFLRTLFIWWTQARLRFLWPIFTVYTGANFQRHVIYQTTIGEKKKTAKNDEKQKSTKLNLNLNLKNVTPCSEAFTSFLGKQHSICLLVVFSKTIIGTEEKTILLARWSHCRVEISSKTKKRGGGCEIGGPNTYRGGFTFEVVFKCDFTVIECTLYLT